MPHAPTFVHAGSLADRYRGALLGLAAGDALGTTLEFESPGHFAPISDMVGGGPFSLPAGAWTDDTSMALCLATSLVECRGFDAGDQMRRYVRWYREGYLSSTGTCFDCGGTTGAALRQFERDGNPYSGSNDPHHAGNGSLMRLAPVPLAFAAEPALAVDRAAASSRTTHATEEAVDACRFFAGLLVGALQGRPRQELMAPGYAPVPGLWESQPLAPAVAAVAAGSYLRKAPPAIRGTGYVVASLEAALWAFSSATDFREGALLAANLGEDADTTAAVYGQLAGAFWGAQSIPAEWRAKLVMVEQIEALADGLLALAGGGVLPG
jgi:ADP-ribosylglycohydrolase